MEKKILAKRVLIAAAGSGSGKTTVTCALLLALKNKGLEPVAYKCGPDYIDPLFHKKVAGVESRNLDVFFAKDQGVRSVLSECGDRYAVLEGVMGLYDGQSPEGIQGSCYEIAALTRTPVIVIVDASGIGRTVISLIKGLLTDDGEHLIKGIVLNKISAHFYKKLKPVLEKELSDIRDDVRLLGFFPKDASVALESRYLGLKLPWEVEGVREKAERAATLLSEHADLEGILSVMEAAPALDVKEEAEAGGQPGADGEGLPGGHTPEDGTALRVTPPLTLAVALDDAFCFYYRENLEQFARRGVRIRYFSPLTDQGLPEGTDGILLGGGYPENHLEALSKNRTMRDAIRESILAGIPALAECGGFMYLHRAITDVSGNRYEMAGAFDAECSYAGHLVHFGYLKITDVKEPFASDGLMKSLVGMKGHEFHYFESTKNGDAFRAAAPSGERARNCMIALKNGLFGFPHFYYASDPAFIDAFILRMQEMRRTRS